MTSYETSVWTGQLPAAVTEDVARDRGPGTDESPAQFCSESSKIFRVRASEVALLRVQGSMLRFSSQRSLAIPLSSSSTIAAHTAISKKVELFNNFPRVKHASIF